MRETPTGPAASPRRPRATFLALALVLLPYVHAFQIHVRGQELSVPELFLYPVLLGGAEIALIVILIRRVFHERVSDLDRRPGRALTDLPAGVLLCVASVALMMAHSVLLAPLLPQRTGPPPQAVETLFRALAGSPLLLALWLGPVVWIGVATFEELSRVFLLDRLWKLWPGSVARGAVLLLSAVLWGLVHIYQGVSNVASIFLLGVMYGLYYLRFGRVRPLIISHALFDSAQIVMAVAAGGGG